MAALIDSFLNTPGNRPLLMLRKRVAVDVRKLGQQGEAHIGQLDRRAVPNLPETVEREPSAVRRTGEVHEHGAGLPPIGRAQWPLEPRVLVTEIVPLFVREVASGVVGHELFGFGAHLQTGICDHAEIEELVGGSWIPDRVDESRGEATAGGAAFPQPPGQVEMSTLHVCGRAPLSFEPGRNLAGQTRILREDCRFDVGAGALFVLAGQSAPRSIGRTYDDIVSVDPDLGVEAIQCSDGEAELHQGLDLGRIAGPAQQVAYDPNVLGVSVFGETGSISSALPPICDGRHDLAGARHDSSHVCLNVGTRQERHWLVQIVRCR